MRINRLCLEVGVCLVRATEMVPAAPTFAVSKPERPRLIENPWPRPSLLTRQMRTLRRKAMLIAPWVPAALL